jgi:hypothetical protein
VICYRLQEQQIELKEGRKLRHQLMHSIQKLWNNRSTKNKKAIEQEQENLSLAQNHSNTAWIFITDY